MAWTDSRWSGQFSDGLDSFQMAWIVSRLHEMSTHGLEKFKMAWNVSRWHGMSTNIWPWKFTGGLESFHVLWTDLFQPSLECFQMVCLQKLSRFTKTFQVALLPCYLGFSVSFSAHLILSFSPEQLHILSLIHIWRCRRSTLCRSRWSPYH